MVVFKCTRCDKRATEFVHIRGGVVGYCTDCKKKLSERVSEDTKKPKPKP